MTTSRFAPTTSGEPHPGTLLSALLVWLDAKQQGLRTLLRLEDLDRERCKPGWADAIAEATAWLGLAWDVTQRQTDAHAQHAATLDQLAELGCLYECHCTRAQLAGLPRAPDGTVIYDNRCRALTVREWRNAGAAVRVCLPDERTLVHDEGGCDLSQHVPSERGDPVVVRRDGAVAYMLGVVVDDHAAHVTRVVRGRDIASSTATQVALARMLGMPSPTYRHHLLLLEARDGTAEKLAKLHGSLPLSQLRATHTPAMLRGVLAYMAGLVPEPSAVSLNELRSCFAWEKVRRDDVLVRWDGARWHLGGV